MDPTEFMPLRLGLLGLSPHSRTLVDAARRSDRVEIVAVAVRDRERLQEWSEDEEDISSIRIYDSYNALLRDPELDAARPRVRVSNPASDFGRSRGHSKEGRKDLWCAAGVHRAPDAAAHELVLRRREDAQAREASPSPFVSPSRG